MPPRDVHPLVLAVMDLWARSAGWEPADVWRWLSREEAPPERFVRAAVEVFYPLVRETDFLPLPSGHDHATLATAMQAQTRSQRVSRARLTKAAHRHPFVKALKDRGLTVLEFAADVGYPRTTVQSWYSTHDPRPIPRAAAERIRDMLGVPLSVWTNVTP